jgi:hypothetical protein
MATPREQWPDEVRATLLAFRRADKVAGRPRASCTKVPRKWRGCNLHSEGYFSLAAFSRCNGQWRYASMGMGGALRTGLDNTAVKATLEMMQIPAAQIPEISEDIDFIAREVLAYEADERKAKEGKAA